MTLTLPPWMTAALHAGRKRLRRLIPPRQAQPGLNTLADADEFIAILRPTIAPSPLLHHEPPELTSRLRTTPLVAALPAGVEGFPVGGRQLTLIRTEDSPVLSMTLDMRTPIFDALTRERRRRVEALRMPTMEVRTVFDALVDRWLCSHCEEGECESCPGCSCSCKLAAVAA